MSSIEQAIRDALAAALRDHAADLRRVIYPALLKVADASGYLSIGEATLRHMITDGEMPVIRTGKRAIRLKRADLDRWIEQRRRS